MEENKRLKLLQRLSKAEGRNLDQVISELCNILETESDGFLKDWIKVNLAHAIGAYNTKWFALCRSNFEKAMERIAQNIIDDDICRYTQEIMAQLDLKGNRRHTTRNHNAYNLLFNSYSKHAIKLVPCDILLNLPVADNVDANVEELAAYNQRLRDIVNRDIGDIWLETTKAYRKEILLKEIKTNKEFFV